jgi:phage/plasmid-like protein (TIGR03299 family)
MLKAANLDWSVRKEPAPGARLIDERKKTYDRYAVLREPVGRETSAVTLALVGKGYEPLQNLEAFKFFEPFVDSNWAEFHTAGALGNGERVWVLARIKQPIVIGHGDTIDRFLLLSNTHNGRNAVSVRFTPIRVVCQNTLNFAMKSKKGFESIRHTRWMRDHIKKAQIAELRRLIDATFAEAENVFRRMYEIKVSNETTEKYLEALFPRTQRQKEKKETPLSWGDIRKILRDSSVSPRGSEGTLWALYNAVTRYEDYRISSEKTPDARLARVWFGRGEKLKMRALDEARDRLAAAA